MIIRWLVVLLVCICSSTAMAADEGKTPVQSKLSADFYGYVKLDGSYDTNGIYPGNYAMWANALSVKKSNQFNLTANSTRFGFDLAAPQIGDMSLSGKIELDLFSNMNAENKPLPMMRHAYLKMDWKDSDFAIIAGQTVDIISPLNANTINYTVLWSAGNIGYRRAQIQFHKGFAFREKSKLLTQFGVARVIGHDNALAVTNNGNDSTLPVFQTRVAYSTPMLIDKPTVFGVWGHWSSERYQPNATTDLRLVSYSLGSDLKFPLCDKSELDAEFFRGKNLDSYFGGISQGVNSNNQEVNSVGGWAQLAMGPFEKFRFNAGYGRDTPYTRDLIGGMRSANHVFFGNMYYDASKALTFALDVSRWITKYWAQSTGTSNRVQTAMILNF